MGWEWIAQLRADEGGFSWAMVRRFAVKVFICFLIINVLYVLVQPLSFLYTFTVYNHVIPGRSRFSFVEGTPVRAAAVERLDALFADHEISGPQRSPDEFRVAFLGDSATWGFFLSADDTASGCLNRRAEQLADGRVIRAFNLGYPAPNVVRDLLLLRKALNYQLDHVVWFISAIGMDRARIFDQEFITANADQLNALLADYPLRISSRLVAPAPVQQISLWDRTLFAQRRQLGIWLRDQLYGLQWAQSHLDAEIRFFLPYSQTEVDKKYGNFYTVGVKRGPDEMTEDDYLFDGVAAAFDMTARAGVKLTVVMQPMWSVPAGSTQYRYNELYPFWYFDAVEHGLHSRAEANGWDYQNWSSILPYDQFTDSPFHYTAAASCLLADNVATLLRERHS